MSRVFWDSNLFIYLIEDYKELSRLTVQLATRMTERNDQLVTSTFALGEVLVHPSRMGSEALCKQYENVIARRAILVPFDREAARLYGMIRKDRTLRAPDAIQLACASRENVDLFVTNDDRLSKKVVPGIHFIADLERAVQVL